MSSPRDRDTVATSLAAGTPTGEARTLPAPAGAPDAVLEPGARIGRYTIVRPLGEGGMGVVYAARDAELAREVALKLLHGRRRGHAMLELRLQREAQAMARLQHDNVVRVFDVGSHAGQVFLAMELVDGETVAQWLAAAPPTWREVVDVYRAAGRGLAEAHAAGIVHRDFKPANMMIDRRGGVRVTDFGLARAADSVDDPPPSGGDDLLDQRVTREGALVGTPRYMAPEQLARGDATAKSDQFAFAVALFEGIAGAPPFPGASTDELLEAIRAGGIAASRASRIPGWLRRVLARALAADPARRFPSMDALLAALDRGRRRRARVAIAAGVLALGATTAALAFALGAGRAAPACARAADRVDAAWTPAERARVLDAMPRLRPAFGAATARRAVARLDAYAAQLREERIGACRATLGEATAGYDPQCLDEQLRSLATVARAIGDAPTPEVVDRADAILGGLATCDRTAASQVAPPLAAQRAPVGQLQDELVAADVRAARGDYAGALGAIRPLVARARQLGYAPLTAQLVDRAGHLELTLDDAHAEADLREAAETSSGARDDRTAAHAWTGLLALAGKQPEHPDRLETTLVAARAAAARTADPADAAAVDLTYGQALLDQDKQPEDEQSCRRALDELAKLHGAHSLAVRPALHCIGFALEQRGAYPEARAMLERAIAIDHDILGDDHPDTADDTDALAKVELDTGHFDEGLALSERAIAVRERVFGADSDVVAVSHRTIANLLIDGGHPTEALPHLQRAIAIGEHNHGAGAVQVAGAYASLGTAYHDLHRYADARPLLERAIAAYGHAGQLGNLGITYINLADLLISTKHFDEGLVTARRAQDALERGMGKDASVVGFALFDQARCLNETGKPADAIPLLERALQLMDPATSDPDNVPMFQFELARALWDAGRDHARAVDLATKAHAAFDKLGDVSGAADQRAESAAWLASHHAR